MDKGVTDTVKNHKRQHDDDEDDDEEPSAGPNQGKKTKKRRTKESKSSMKSSTTKETSKGKASSKSSKTAPKTNKPSRDTWFKQPLRPLTPDPEWNKRQVVTAQLEQPWFNHIDSAAKDPLTFDELMATPIDFSKSQINKFSKHNVYSTQKILGVKSVNVKKLHGYGHLEEIVVKRADRQLYKFKEGDFIDLHLNTIEDMLLFAVQHKLFHLDGSEIVDFIVALRMFTRNLIIKRRVKDLQLGVESYQKKLNINEPQKTFLEIEFKEFYTPSHKPPARNLEDLKTLLPPT
ncbi:hypothetical protein Tco_1222548 [Tanacetum coccineum]